MSYISLAYGVPDRMIHDTGQDLTLNQKVAADLLEAHIG